MKLGRKSILILFDKYYCSLLKNVQVNNYIEPRKVSYLYSPISPNFSMITHLVTMDLIKEHVLSFQISLGSPKCIFVGRGSNNAVKTALLGSFSYNIV